MPTKKPPSKKSTGKKRGPPVKPQAERARSVNTSLPAAVALCCERVGDGSASRGLRLIAIAYEKENGE